MTPLGAILWLFSKLKTRAGLEIAGGLLMAALGGAVVHHLAPVPVQVLQTTPNTTTINVPQPVITPKVVTQLIKDPAQQKVIQAQLAQINSLNAEVTQLTDTVAELQQKGGTGGGGGVITVETPAPTAAVPMPEPLYTFKDWQLQATYNSKQFAYSLDQNFLVTTATGHQENGQLITTAQLYQKEASGDYKQVPSQTVSVFANPNAPHFIFTPRVQGGVGIVTGDTSGFAAVMQWIRHGTSQAPEDTRWSFLSPGIFINSKNTDVGVLPFSFNAGTLPHQPFTNVWFSPYITIDKKIGGIMTVTF